MAKSRLTECSQHDISKNILLKHFYFKIIWYLKSLFHSWTSWKSSWSNPVNYTLLKKILIFIWMRTMNSSNLQNSTLFSQAKTIEFIKIINFDFKQKIPVRNSCKVTVIVMSDWITKTKNNIKCFTFKLSNALIIFINIYFRTEFHKLIGSRFITQ